MSKPFDYSKWDKIELSDDEDDVHPNIDKESWFRMKHRSRVEREENEEKDKQKILQEMEKANKRIKILQHDLEKLSVSKASEDCHDESDDDDLDDREGLQAELNELLEQNKARQDKLNEYEKNKKWNVDNMCKVKEERTIINPKAAKTNFTPSGYAVPKEDGTSVLAETKAKLDNADKKMQPKKASSDTKKEKLTSPQFDTTEERNSFDTYPEFVEKYADTVELFMKIPDLEGSKDFLLKYGDILLQENASNYLLLASLEDEMNGYHEKMKRTARQSQIISHIAELAKTMKTHPGNVIMPFFARLEQREHLEEFLEAVKGFQEKIVKRAIVKKQEMDSTREPDEPKALEDIPLEERLGPGGLDPLEVIKTLPTEMVEAFESRDVQKLKDALMQMDPEEAERHMKRCVDSGLWVANS